MATPGRPRDEVWKEVDVGDDGKLTCRRCRKRFKGGVARIKAHLGNEKGKGISLCKPGNVPVNEGVNNSIMAGSSNPPEAVNGMNPLEGPVGVAKFTSGITARGAMVLGGKRRRKKEEDAMVGGRSVGWLTGRRQARR